MPLPPSVSLFLLRECNAHCRFCYATFRDVSGRLPTADWVRILFLLAEAGAQKVTFVGGEPTLHPDLAHLVRVASGLGLTTTVVTNGARLPQLLRGVKNHLHWVGLDLDSADPATEVALGRGDAGYVNRVLQHAALCREHGIKVKLNTVVTRLSWQEDMSEIVRTIRPDRWKAFQVLPSRGQNDGKVEDLLISDAQFAAWVGRHAHLDDEGLAPVVETNDLMRDSYALVDPIGRFFSNNDGHTYGPAILEVGVETAWASVAFDEEKFLRRGGKYAW